MTEMKTISSAAALDAALHCAGLCREDICVESVELSGGYYELQFATDWMEYDCFVDAETGEVPGFSCQPLAEPAVEIRAAA